MMVRTELGGYCPRDPLEFAFISTVIALKNVKEDKSNTLNRLQNVIQKSK